jgi:hypothetical protein
MPRATPPLRAPTHPYAAVPCCSGEAGVTVPPRGCGGCAGRRGARRAVRPRARRARWQQMRRGGLLCQEAAAAGTAAFGRVLSQLLSCARSDSAGGGAPCALRLAARLTGGRGDFWTLRAAQACSKHAPRTLEVVQGPFLGDVPPTALQRRSD